MEDVQSEAEYIYANGRYQAGVYEHDARFFVGWVLDKSFILCTVSWVVLLLNAASVLGAAFVLVPEDDYEEIPDR